MRDGTSDAGTGMRAHGESHAAAPGWVIINEVLYNGVGPDVVGTDQFIELYGDPGLDLAGYRLVGVEGGGGYDYNQIALSGTIPGDGYFVVGRAEVANVDLVPANPDFQNGPDNIQLRWFDVVVDAVGYGGEFVDFSFFVGEFLPHPGVLSAGTSIGRTSSNMDTNNNLDDFFIDATLGGSPGTANPLPP